MSTILSIILDLKLFHNQFLKECFGPLHFPHVKLENGFGTFVHGHYTEVAFILIVMKKLDDLYSHENFEAHFKTPFTLTCSIVYDCSLRNTDLS